jgi:putative tryptophan/tyrosine transport system substrate-binding protein
MRRRDFLPILAGMAFVASHGAAAQTDARFYRIGFLTNGAPITKARPYWGPFTRSLEKRGYVLGRNLLFESRGAETNVKRLPRLIEELVANKVDLIIVTSYPAALAAKGGTTLPVVAFQCGDPVATGLIESLARPGGHMTGIADMTVELSPKRLQLLKELVPELRNVAMIWNAGDPGMTLRYEASKEAAHQLKINIQPLGVREAKDFDTAFAAIMGTKPDAVFIVTDALLASNRRRLLDFTSANGLPTIFEGLSFIVRDGSLMFYGPDINEVLDRVTYLVDRILKGAKPADLPFEQPTVFRFGVNAKAAKALGVTIPPAILLRADEVIE